MQTLLIIITTLSIGAAIAMAIVMIRLLREDRERSDARVAALAALAGEPEPRIEPAASMPLQPAEPAGAFKTLSAPPVRLATEQPRGAQAVRWSPVPERELFAKPATEPFAEPATESFTDPGELFAAPAETSPWGRRIAIAGCLAGLLAAIVLVATLKPARSNAHATSAAAVANVRPLELLELRHARDG